MRGLGAARLTRGTLDGMTHLWRDPERVVISLFQMHDMVRPVRQVERHHVVIVGIRDGDDAKPLHEDVDGPRHMVRQGVIHPIEQCRLKIPAVWGMKTAPPHDTRSGRALSTDRDGLSCEQAMRRDGLTTHPG